MAGKRKTLTPGQQIALQEVRRANKKLREAKAELELKLRQQLEQELATLETAQALAVRRAFALEVPKTRIGAEGLLNTDPHNIQRILARTEHMNMDAGATAGAFSWIDKGKRVRVDFPGFPTTSIATDYPETLSGVVEPDHNAPNGWRVISDDSDQETEYGVLPGLLRYEVEDVPRSQEGSLTGMLDAWTAEHPA